jgi:hypothetical protein
VLFPPSPQPLVAAEIRGRCLIALRAGRGGQLDALGEKRLEAIRRFLTGEGRIDPGRIEWKAEAAAPEAIALRLLPPR